MTQAAQDAQASPDQNGVEGEIGRTEAEELEAVPHLSENGAEEAEVEEDEMEAT